jgi:transposase
MNNREIIRLEQFRQLKREIRGSEEHLIVGIDVAKQKHNAFLGTATGKTLKRLVFENNREGFEKLLMHVESISASNGHKKVTFGIEPTANYHKPLAEFLINKKHELVLVSGVAVKRNRELLDGRWDKNDMKDSANVADLISQGKCLFYEHPALVLRDLRSLLSLKKKFKKIEHGFRVRIRNHLLAQYFPELDRYYGHSESENLAIVRWCLSPSKIAEMKYEDFFRLATTRNRGLTQHQRLKAIWDNAHCSVGCSTGTAAEFEAEILVEALKQVRETIGSINEKVIEICVLFPEYNYLLSIPGFGPVVSATVIAAIGDPFRFESGKQVLKTAGWDLSANRSGKRSDTVTPVISKRGKSDLRYALYQAALIASARNRHVTSWFIEKLRGREKEQGIKTRMRVKLAAKLLIIAWTLMKKKEPFNPELLKIKK